MNRIDEVLVRLEEVIAHSETADDPAGYFAALYHKVTTKVKEGIAAGFFDDGERMERLDVDFAERYLQAWDAWQRGEPLTESWRLCFVYASRWRPIVLQHLLVGMNAHINLDLGIAAAECMNGKQLDDLKDDFDRINAILSGLVHEVQDKLSAVWPALKWLLKLTGKVDDYLVDFSMKKARDGAWKFAGEYFACAEAEKAGCMEKRDQRIREIAAVVTQAGVIGTTVLFLVRISERGTVSEKIAKLRSTKV